MPTQSFSTFSYAPAASQPAKATDVLAQAAAVVLELVAQAEGPAREHFLEAVSHLLRPASPLPRAQHLALARLADYLTSRREAEQLAADPTLRAARREAAAHFGPKAQNSLAPLPEA